MYYMCMLAERRREEIERGKGGGGGGLAGGRERGKEEGRERESACDLNKI